MKMMFMMLMVRMMMMNDDDVHDVDGEDDDYDVHGPPHYKHG